MLISDRSEVLRPLYNQVKNAPTALRALSPLLSNLKKHQSVKQFSRSTLQVFVTQTEV